MINSTVKFLKLGFLLFSAIIVIATSQICRAEKAMQIVATTQMIHDLVKQLIVDVEDYESVGIFRSGVDPHLYKPNRDDILTIARGDIVFYNGLHLEGKMTKVLRAKLGKLGEKSIVPVAEVEAVCVKITPECIEGYFVKHDPEGLPHDPHIWMDVKKWQRVEEVIYHILRPLTKFQDRLDLNHKKLHARLTKLDEYVKEQVARVPASQRYLITAHDAFNYFGDRYKFTVVGVQGVSTDSEASLAHLKYLVQLIVENKIRSVFAESSVPSKQLSSLVEGAQAMGQDVKIKGELYSDSMASEGPASNYVGMIKTNVDNIVGNLVASSSES